MSLWRIAWRSIQQRGLASALTSLSMALGVMLVVAVLLIMGVVSESFRSNSSLGYNMIIGAKGGRLQLVLNTVYYLSAPVENVPYTFYLEFLDASQRPDGRDGKYSLYTDFAIPLCLGDYYQGYRVVGTTTRMFDDYVYDVEQGKKYEFAAGRNFVHHSPEYGFKEAVIGARVARETGLKLGDAFAPTHGPEGEAHDEFHVVGILQPTGTPNDRALFVNMEGFYLLSGHAKPVEEDDEAGEAEQSGEQQADTTDSTPTSPEPAELATAPAADTGAMAQDRTADQQEAHPAHAHQEPLPIEQREVTAILLRTIDPVVTSGLRNTINEGPVAQAVLPIAEIYQLFANFVTPIKTVLLILTTMICVVSGVSILVSIYNSMSDRRHEIAVMRALGAGRHTVMMVVLLESVILSLGGGLAGWTAGHILIGGAASPLIEDRTGVSVSIFDFSPPLQFDSALLGRTISTGVSTEVLLIPALILLAIVVGFLPAMAAYRTDVARALTANP
jgi:putative ABC transport system permease protein